MKSLRVIGAWILQSLVAALFVIQGIVKLSGSPAWVSRFQRWGYPSHFYLVVGLFELVAGFALLIPRVTKWGALVLIVVMAGATATHAVHGEPQVFTTVVLLSLVVTFCTCVEARLGHDEKWARPQLLFLVSFTPAKGVSFPSCSLSISQFKESVPDGSRLKRVSCQL